MKTQKRFKDVLRTRQRRSLTLLNQTDKKEVRTTPAVIEGAAARSSSPIERKGLMKQARNARAERAVKCSLMFGERASKRNPLTELYVNSSFTEDRGAWEKEFITETLCGVFSGSRGDD